VREGKAALVVDRLSQTSCGLRSGLLRRGLTERFGWTVVQKEATRKQQDSNKKNKKNKKK
jgi:hypothetical protein